MKITNLRCLLLPAQKALLLRIDTDEGVYGWSQVEQNKHSYLAPQILHCKPFLLGLDPTDVENCMRRIRRLGAFKPWGGAVSSIEIALWDLAGKAAGLPVYKLLGGKVRDRVRVYMGGPPPFTPHVPYSAGGDRPEDYYSRTKARRERGRGIGIMKTAVGFHDNRWRQVDGYHYGIAYAHGETLSPTARATGGIAEVAGMVTERGLAHTVECVAAVREALGADVAMALDCGPGWKVPGAVEFARRVEALRPLWLEDLVTGDYTPYVGADLYRAVKQQTHVNLHTGEQIYLRQNFRELIETRAVDVVGPDPMDVGGLAELKWVAEFADLHGILMAPHGIGDGPFGLAALVQVCATLPDNYIAFELPIVGEEWRGLVTGIVEGMVEDGFVRVSDAPGLGVDIVEEEVRRALGTAEIYLGHARTGTPA
ncbi:MAG: mandelate racemase/muconate lactonizing enzyme family protein [Lentisphaeria bacterium]|nr:mandelate racemase/muconate lactonizing enzyme family protein [Lentisphaeria bacterium]